MAAATAAGGVQPEPVTNRRTGEVTEFGHRRAFDGAWVVMMLNAYGCTKAEVDAAIFVLKALVEYDVRIDKKLPELLAMFYEQPSQKELARMFAEHNRPQLVVDNE
jgi:hypothetical protein